MSREFNIEADDTQEELGHELLRAAKDFAVVVEQEDYEMSATLGDDIKITVEVKLERVEDN